MCLECHIFSHLQLRMRVKWPLAWGNLGSGHEGRRYLESNKLFANDNGKFPAISGFRWLHWPNAYAKICIRNHSCCCKGNFWLEWHLFTVTFLGPPNSVTEKRLIYERMFSRKPILSYASTNALTSRES